MKPAYRIRAYSHERLKWVVRGKENGKWVRKYFETKAEATTYAQIKNTDVLNLGTQGAEFPLALRVMALEGENRLKPFGKTIQDAVNFYLPHLERQSRATTVQALVQQAKQAKIADGAKKPTVTEFGHRGGKFADAFPDREIGSLTREEIEDWLRSYCLNPVTRNNYRKVVVNLFNHAVQKGLLDQNPAAKIKKAREERSEIGILTPQQVKALLTNASEEILPYFAIAVFAGIRPEEIAPPQKSDSGLEWSDVRWKQGVIRVRAEVSKVGKARNVKIEPNLKMWLQPYQSRTGRVASDNWRDLFRETRKLAEVEVWPHDCLRHSFATYWLEIHRDAPALALEMGNSVEIVLDRYSKVLDEPNDARAFWALVPGPAKLPSRPKPPTDRNPAKGTPVPAP